MKKKEKKSARQELQDWFDEERKKGLIDIKLCPGETSKSSIESLSRSLLSIVENEELGRYEILTQVR
jgi:hypothetical protein